jgi:hypothetical protein
MAATWTTTETKWWEFLVDSPVLLTITVVVVVVVLDGLFLTDSYSSARGLGRLPQPFRPFLLPWRQPTRPHGVSADRAPPERRRRGGCGRRARRRQGRHHRDGARGPLQRAPGEPSSRRISSEHTRARRPALGRSCDVPLLLLCFLFWMLWSQPILFPYTLLIKPTSENTYLATYAPYFLAARTAALILCMGAQTDYLVYTSKLQLLWIWKQECREQKMFCRHILHYTIILIICIP